MNLMTMSGDRQQERVHNLIGAVCAIFGVGFRQSNLNRATQAGTLGSLNSACLLIELKTQLRATVI